MVAYGDDKKWQSNYWYSFDTLFYKKNLVAQSQTIFEISHGQNQKKKSQWKSQITQWKKGIFI